MRSPLGSSILLVLVLGLVCLNPVRSYYYDGESQEVAGHEASMANQRTETLESSSPSELATGNIEPQGQSKRTMGMPALVTARELSSAGQILQSNVGETMESGYLPPINPPPGMPAIQSNGRGIGADILSSMGAGQQQTQQQVGQQSQDLPPPTIIEKGTVSPQLSQQSQPQQIQQQPPQQIPQIQQAVPFSSSDHNSPNNQTMPMSTARTFESWLGCVGSGSSKYGTCKNDVECSKMKGRADGSCMGGFGVCCVMALSCGDKSFENNTFYANPDFPEPSWEARLCEVEVKKKHSKILQVMIEFEEFEIAPPNPDGECTTDVFQVKLASNRPSPYSQLRICGQNTGQHMYLDVSQIDEPLVLSVATSGGGFPRRWSIRIVQMDDKNYLLAPPGCLQYYTDTVGHFRSFNLGKNLKNLYYAICFRIDNGYSGVRFTSNFFGMNGPFCRKKQGGGYFGRNNGSFEAYPHHLVIPPPGYRHPLPQLGSKFGGYQKPLPYEGQKQFEDPKFKFEAEKLKFEENKHKFDEHLKFGFDKPEHKFHHGGRFKRSFFSSNKETKLEKKDKYNQHHEALFPMMRLAEMPPCEPRFCGQNDVITFPPSGDSISEMCGNRFNRGRGPKTISGSPLVAYVSNRGHTRGAGFDMNYEQVFYIPSRHY